MGCGGSKLDDQQQAVALCRRRTKLIAEAIRQRHDIADSHAAYARSLRTVGSSLHLLIAAAALPPPPPPPPVLPPPPPPQDEIVVAPPPSSSPPPATESEPPAPQSAGDSPESAAAAGEIHYYRSQPAAAAAFLTFEQRPKSPETVRYSDPYSGYDPKGCDSGYGGGMWGFWGVPSSSSSPAKAADEPSSSRTPPPPSPPQAAFAAWDFLNPFQALESYYLPYSPRSGSNEVREGVKEVHEELPASWSSAAPADLEVEDIRDLREDPPPESLKDDVGPPPEAPGGSNDDVGPPPEAPASSKDDVGPLPEGQASSEDDVQVEEKNVAADEPEELREATPFEAPAASNGGGASDVAGTIKVQFDRASETTGELSKMLEVGKLPYRQSISVHHQVSSRMISVASCTSVMEDLLVFEEGIHGSKTLSSTLQTLFVWEKKLYDELKAEEKMRALHYRKCNKLKLMEENGAHAHKINSIQSEISDLSTKIRITIRTVASISKKINRLRDEELWPQIYELIQGFHRMWKVMLECHQTQHLLVAEAKNLHYIDSSGGMLANAHLEMILKLELELLEWIGNFSAWVSAQKRYVRALNAWLLLCVRREADGTVPFSPGRIGAPPLFVVCNYWSQMLDRVSMWEVIAVMKAFAETIRHVWEQHNSEERIKRFTTGDVRDGLLRARETNAQTMNKAADVLDKRLVSATGRDVFSVMMENLAASEAGGTTLLGLRRVFEGLESFTASTVRAYGQLCARCEEERFARGNAKVP